MISIDRKRYFSFTQLLHEYAGILKTPTNKVCFLVAAGYFKARPKFFARQFYQVDIDYVANQLGIAVDDVKLETYSKAPIFKLSAPLARVA